MVVIYNLTPLIILLISVVLIVYRENQKAFRGDEIYARSLFEFSGEIIFFGFMSLFAYLSFNTLWDSYQTVYPILVPHYFDHWYQLLWLDNITVILEQMRENGELTDELFKLNRYYSNLRTFLNALMGLAGSTYPLYRGLQRVEIREEGIFDKDKWWLWERITKTEWDGPYKGWHSEKYDLIIVGVPEKKSIIGHSESETKREIPVSPEDVDTVDQLIRKNQQAD